MLANKGLHSEYTGRKNAGCLLSGAALLGESVVVVAVVIHGLAMVP